MSEINIVDSDPTLAQNLKGHRKQVTDLSFHPDNKQLASSSQDASVMLWNLVSQNRRCFSFLGHSDSVTAVEFSNSGRLLASCSQDKTVRLWVPTIRGGSSDFKAHTSPVRTLAFSPQDDKLITGSNDKSIKIWDVQTRRFISSLTGHTNWVRCVKCTPDGKLIISSADDKTVRVWDVSSGQCIHVFTGAKGSGNHLAVHNSGNIVAVATNTGTVRLYEIQENKLRQHYSLHDNTTSVVWHPFANYFLSGGRDGTMKIVDIAEGRPLYTLKAHQGGVSAVAFSPEGDKFASAGFNRHVMIWNTNFITRICMSQSTSSSSQETV